MSLYQYYPLPSDRMGTLWTLCSIKDAYIIEFGPSGNTSFEIEGFISLNTECKANVFTTHINESNITFGESDNLIAAVKEVEKKYSPEVIFILASSLVAVTGTDIVGICAEMQQQVKARIIVADKGGYIGDYTLGIRNTLKMLCSEVVKNNQHNQLCDMKYNIIGSQADCYNYRSDVKEIKRLLKKYLNLKCNTILTSNTSLSEIYSASKSKFNVVMRCEGLDGAEILKKRFNQEYIFGRVYGEKATVDFLKSVSKITGIKINKKLLNNEVHNIRSALFAVKQLLLNKEISVAVSGNYDLVLGLKKFFEELGIKKILGIINHNIKKCGTLKENIIINPSEDEKKSIILKLEPDIVLGDAVLIEMARPLKNTYSFQISNPNLSRIKLYNGTPYVGFNGIAYLSEILCNILKNI